MGMGPILICDKSTLQGLGRAELNVLRRYFFLNVPPVLLIEILGDLKKHTEASMNQGEVKTLAEKLVPACSVINMDFRSLIAAELKGGPVELQGRPVLDHGRPVVDDDGKKGVVFNQTPEEEALLRWQTGQFKEAEESLAVGWRKTTQGIDLEALKRQLHSHYSPRLKLRSLEHCAEFVVDLIVSTPPSQLLPWFLLDSGVDLQSMQPAMTVLEKTKQPFSKAFPYTAHCIRVGLIFHFGLAFGLIGTRPTNRVDMEYLYYSPFCFAFSSGDLFHRQVTPLILRNNQTFIERDELKSDLRTLATWWSNLSETEQANESLKQGPPENDASITHRLWKAHMRPGYRENQKIDATVSPLPPKLLSQLKKQSENLRSSSPHTGSSDDLDFIIKKHVVRANGPCICGSDKIFRECCGRKLMK